MHSVNIHIRLLQSKREQLWNITEANLQILFSHALSKIPFSYTLLPTLQQNIKLCEQRQRAGAVGSVFGMQAIQQVRAKLH